VHRFYKIPCWWWLGVVSDSREERRRVKEKTINCFSAQYNLKISKVIFIFLKRISSFEKNLI